MHRQEPTPYDTLKYVTWPEVVLSVAFAALGIYALTVIPTVETWNPGVLFGAATILILAVIVPVCTIYRASRRRTRVFLAEREA